MALIGRQQIIDADDAEEMDIPVEAWGGDIRVRSLSIDVRLALSAKYDSDDLTNESATDFYCELFTISAVNESGEQLFTEAELGLLKKKNWNVLEEVCNEILTFNGMRKEDVEETVKNSESSPNGS